MACLKSGARLREGTVAPKALALAKALCATVLKAGPSSTDPCAAVLLNVAEHAAKAGALLRALAP